LPRRRSLNLSIHKIYYILNYEKRRSSIIPATPLVFLNNYGSKPL